MTLFQQLIALDSITVTRGDRHIVDSVSWTVNSGEHWALLGANGSGKTTLLNIITGYVWPSSGMVTVLGDRYGEVDLREKRRKIGLVSSALFERVPGHESFHDIVLSGRFASLGMYDEPDAADHDRATEIAVFLGREKILDRPWRVLSFGERQSALIGRALMADPAILMLDEPFEGLDMPTREHLVDRIDSLIGTAAGPAILFVTHRIEELPAGISHAALMRGGSMPYCGPVAEVITSDAMTDAFGISVEVLQRNGRLSAHVR